MKIPGSVTAPIQEDEIQESPFLSAGDSQKEVSSVKEDMDKILQKKKDASPLTEEKEESEEAIFAKTYLIGHADIGLTPEEVFDRVHDIKKEPTQEEEDILRALLFEGYYEHSFAIGKIGSFSLRTVSPMTILRAEESIQKVCNEKNLTPFHMRVAMIGRALSYYMGKRTCSFTDQESFESDENIEKRIRLVLSLPSYVVDTIAEALQSFGNKTSDVTRRNLSNF